MKKFLRILFFLILFSNQLFCENQDFNCIRGVDLSYLQQIESENISFYDTNKNEIEDIIPFFKSIGINCVRLRLWVNPENSNENNYWCNLDNTVIMAKRIKDSGLKLLLDIHYSDSWADPSNQKIPSEWIKTSNKLSLSSLESLVRAYTEKVLTTLTTQNIYPDYIQIGNEITNGMLFPYGQIQSTGTDLQKFTSLATLLTSGIQITRKIIPEAKIILHIDCGSDKEKCQWWYSCAKNAKLDYDIIGLSYYSLWQTKNLDVLSSNISNLIVKFKKPVFIVETAYPWTLKWNDNQNNLYGREDQLIKKYPATKQGQIDYYKGMYNMLLDKQSLALKQKVNELGLFWWEPESIPSENKDYQSAIENLAWFDFENTYFGTGIIN